MFVKSSTATLESTASCSNWQTPMIENDQLTELNVPKIDKTKNLIFSSDISLQVFIIL